MTAPASYTFQPVTLGDLVAITAWQCQPHVREWWDQSKPYAADDLRDTRVRRFIVHADERPFAFMQDYTVHGWGDHHFAHLPKGARGIDQFIGDPDMVGRGHGTAFIADRMQTLFSHGAPVIATDPHPDNTRAIAVYRKLGFTPSGPPQSTAWGLIQPLLAQRK